MKIFEEWLNEATKKEFKFAGWKKITKKQFIDSLVNGKSLILLDRFLTSNELESLQNDASNFVKVNNTILMSIVKQLDKNDKNWRTVNRSTQSSIIFSNNSKLDLSQMGDKTFYEQKTDDGIFYLYVNYNFNEDWEEHSAKLIFYYVPDNVNEELLDEKIGWDSEHPKYILQFNVGLNTYYKKKTSKNFSFTKLDWNINDYITDNIKEADIQDTPDKFKALKKELEVKYPKVIMYLFPNKRVRLSVTTYYSLTK